MSAFYGEHQTAHQAHQPIKLQGFDIPGASSSSSSRSTPAGGGGAGVGNSSIDPAMLFGLSPTSQSHFSNGFGSLGAGGGATYGSSVLSDADLDFESMLASLGQGPTGANGTSTGGHGNGAGGGGGAYGQTNPNAQHHVFGGAAGGATGAGVGGAGSNGFLGSSAIESMGFPSQQPQRNGGPTTPSLAGSHSQQHHYFAAQTPTSTVTSSIPQFSRSPSAGSASLTTADLFPTLHNKDSPLVSGGPGPGSTTEHGSYSSEAFPPPASSKRSPPSNGGSERASSRSRATGVGKAPTSTSRSRSARRSGSVAGYQDRPSPNGGCGPAGGGERSSSSAQQPATSAASHGSAAIIIPSSTATSTSIPPPQSHQYAISMPAYPTPSTTGTPSSLPSISGGWFPTPSQTLSFGSVHTHGTSTPMPMHGHGHHPVGVDPTGWRPSTGIVMPASAPPATGMAAASKKSKGLEDVQEEDGDGKNDPLSEKRRKRRESHNAVERRRRDNINDRISELALLLPETFLAGSSSDQANDTPASPALGVGALSLVSPPPGVAAVLGTSPSSAPGSGYMNGAPAGNGAGGAGAVMKPNKGVVLAKSVEYIRYLQNTLELQSQQVLELQRQNAALQAVANNGQSQPPLQFQSHAQHQQHQQQYQQPQRHPHQLQPSLPQGSALGLETNGEWAAYEGEETAEASQAGGTALKSEDDEGMDES
ncbi:hypothetical protein JCM21900_001703 [Sporobolomyces salmonicolor]